jgi:hypothetical protein
MQPFWAGGTPRRRDVPRWRTCATALSTIVALLTLVAVSGPHLVHHLAERPPHEHQHAQDGPQTRDHQTPPRPDCLVLFLMQHTPVAEEGGALLPTLLLAAEPLLPSLSLGHVDVPRHAVQARAPPLFL